MVRIEYRETERDEGGVGEGSFPGLRCAAALSSCRLCNVRRVCACATSRDAARCFGFRGAFAFACSALLVPATKRK
eukprot:scaffold7115_cov125-Isochrysis_galbana.AAC.9